MAAQDTASWPRAWRGHGGDLRDAEASGHLRQLSCLEWGPRVPVPQSLGQRRGVMTAVPANDNPEPSCGTSQIQGVS